MKRPVAADLLLAVVLAAPALAGPGADLPPLEVSRQTTHVVEPRRADGTPDFAAFLDARDAAGVTPEDNAAALLVRVFDYGLDGPALARLGLAGPPAQVERFFGGVTGTAGGTFVVRRDGSSGPWATEQWLTASRRPWKESEAPLVAEWLQGNERPLALLAEAARRPRCWVPLPAGRPLHEAPAPHPLALRNAANALRARALLRLRAGDAEGAAADVITGLRLAAAVSRGRTALESNLALAVRGTLAEIVPRVAAAPGTTGGLAARLAVAVQAAALRPPLEVGDVDQRLTFLDTLLEVRAGRLQLSQLVDCRHAHAHAHGAAGEHPEPVLCDVPAGAFDWNELLRRANALWDLQVAVGRAATPEAAEQAGNRARAETESLLALRETDLDELLEKAESDPGARRTLAGRLLGEAFAGLGADFGRVRTAWNESQAMARLVVTNLAMKAHRAERGSFPADLAALEAAPPRLDRRPTAGGYVYEIHPGPAAEGAPGLLSYACTAVPAHPLVSGVRAFCVDGAGGFTYTNSGHRPDVVDGHCVVLTRSFLD